MNVIQNVKGKMSAVADKAYNSKAYRKVEQLAVAVGGSLMALGASALNASAIDWGATISAEDAVASIAENASDFIEPAIIIMCAVAGLRLGMKFLRGAVSNARRYSLRIIPPFFNKGGIFMCTLLYPTRFSPVYYPNYFVPVSDGDYSDCTILVLVLVGLLAVLILDKMGGDKK